MMMIPVDFPQWKPAGIHNPLGAELHYRKLILAVISQNKDGHWSWNIPSMSLVGTALTFDKARTMVEEYKVWEAV